MRRRELIAFVGTVLFAWPLVARAQQQAKVARLGYLGFGTPAALATRVEALRAGLRDVGYVEGKNLVIEFRWSSTVEQMHEAAAELARMKVDIIFATSSTEVEAARRATKTISIVFATHADPVSLGHVASLARPGGNITGLSGQVTEVVVKGLEIMKQTLPRMTRIGVLVTLTAPSHRPALHALEAAAPKLGVQVLTVPVRTPEDLDGAFAMMARERVNGFLAVASPLSRNQRTLLAELSLKYRLAGMFGTRENVEVGGLMSYAPNLNDLTRRAATYIDKILKGAKPADLPVEQASKYELVINLKTAKTLGKALGAFGTVVGFIAAIVVWPLWWVGKMLQGIVVKVRKFFAPVEEIWNFLVLPFLGLLILVTLARSFTNMRETDALLIVLVLSVWNSTRRIERIRGHLADIDLYLANIVIRQVPGATGLAVETREDGSRSLTFSFPEDSPKIVDPRGPKGGGR